MARSPSPPRYAKKAYATFDTVSHTESSLDGSGAFGTTPDGHQVVTINVLANDLNLPKGGMRTLYALDDGLGNTQSDLQAGDVTSVVDGHTVSGWESTAGINRVRIYDNQVQLDLDPWLAGRTLDQLTSADRLSDSFSYAIQMADGTLSWNRVTFTLAGEDDPAFVGNAGQFGMYVSPTDPTYTQGAPLTVTDPDLGQAAFTGYSTQTQFGTFTVHLSPDSATWRYDLAPQAAVPFDYDHASFRETLTVTTQDGTQALVEVVLQDRAVRTNDSVYNGGANDDLILCGPGNNNVAGLGGNDTLRGGDGDDSLTGIDGNDALYGEAGNDFLEGGDGDDLLSTGGGIDFVYGNAGNDTYAIDIAAGFLGTDKAFINGFEPGLDRIRLSTAPGSAFAPLGGLNEVLVGNYIFYDSSTGWLSVDLDGFDGPESPVAFARLQSDGLVGVPASLSDLDFQVA